jgi:hypothetical protein
MTHSRFRFLGVAVGATLITVLTVSLAVAGRSDLAGVRAATARFHSLEQAENAGYGQPPAPAPLHFCISDLNGMGAMGYHYINGALLSGDEAGRVVADKPEALVYEPDSQGKLHLVALEYVVFQADWHGPTDRPWLFGHEFDATPAPNRYEIPAFYSLHVWLYKDNPDPVNGIFAPMNMNVSCDGARD